MKVGSQINITIDNVDAFVFDFDGVLTNNFVYLDQDGKEFVCCSRSDGLAFDLLKKLKKPAYILSTEKNPVVTARANKLKILAIQGVSDKLESIDNLVQQEGYDLDKIMYVGNDINDYRAMQNCGYTVCPSDSHEKIKKIATIVLQAEGGNGVARELIENVFQLDLIKILYGN